MLNFSYLLLSTVYFQPESKKLKKTLLKALNIFILSVLAFYIIIIFLSVCVELPHETKQTKAKQYKKRATN